MNRAVLVSCLWLLSAAPAAAELRNYVWTFESDTLSTEEILAEYAMTNQKPDTDRIEFTQWAHQALFSVAFLPRWDIGVYHQFQQAQTPDTADLRYEGFGFRTRFRFLEWEPWLTGATVLANYRRPSDWRKASEGELRLALTKRVAGADVSYNQIMESVLLGDAKPKHRYSAGIGYEIVEGLHAGLEAAGVFGEPALGVGVTGRYAHGDRFYFTWGAIWGANADSPDVESRMLIGLRL